MCEFALKLRGNKMKEKLGLNPWLSIWVRPRETIRALISYNVNYRFLLLSAFCGFIYMLQSSQFLSLGQESSLLSILIVSLLLAIPIGYIVFNIAAVFMYFVGKLIKGKGSYKEVRAAIYWASVPNVVSSFLWIIMMIAFGKALFVTGFEENLPNSLIGMILSVAILHIAIAIWGLIILVKAIVEVQGFSAWMGLLNTFLSWVALSIVLFIITWGVSLIL